MNNEGVQLCDIQAQALPLLSILSTPHLELATLVTFVTGLTQEAYLMHPNAKISKENTNKILELARKRVLGIPLAYLVESKEFYGRNFKVNKHVLIPRPETELLVDTVLEYVNFFEINNNYPRRILDCGTGSGCIGISIAGELEKNFSHSKKYTGTKNVWEIILSDISQDALACASENIHLLLTDHSHRLVTLQLQQGFLLEPVRNQELGIIVANLPYVATNHMEMAELEHEPRLALEGSTFNASYTYHDPNDGTALIALLFEQAQKLKNHHILVLEADPLQFDTLSMLAAQHGYTNQRIRRDLAGYTRVFCAIS